MDIQALPRAPRRPSTRLRAVAIITRSLGFTPPAPVLIAHLGEPGIDAIVGLERAFGIDLEVSDIYGLDVPALLDLVEARAMAARTRTPCAVYDFAGYRDAVSGGQQAALAPLRTRAPLAPIATHPAAIPSLADPPNLVDGAGAPWPTPPAPERPRFSRTLPPRPLRRGRTRLTARGWRGVGLILFAIWIAAALCAGPLLRSL